MAALTVSACKQEPSRPVFKSTDITGADYARKLELSDSSGKRRSIEEFKGKLVLLFFGFTHCPDVCPTALMRAKQIRDALGERKGELQVLFVTVDPERDTAENIGKYVSSFDPSFIGLRGDEKETALAAREFKVFYQKIPNKDGKSYTVDHTAASYILDKTGAPRLYLRPQQTIEEMVADIRQLL